MKKGYSILFLLSAVIFMFAGCSEKGFRLQGNASLDSGSGTPHPIANTPVILVPDSLVSAELSQRREGLSMLIATLSARRNQMVKQLDTLKAAYVASNYQDGTLKSHYSAVTDSLRALNDDVKKFKNEYIGSVAQWLSRRSAARTNTDAKGDFSFEAVKHDKYVLASVYGFSKQSGLLIKPVDVRTAEKVDLTILDRDQVFYIDDEDRP
jgi:hypothetical protein